MPRYWRETPSRYNLFASKCTNCGMIHFPPRTVCPRCHRKSIGKMESVILSGRGKVITYTTIHDAPEAFEVQKPYIVAIIQMEDGIRLTAPLIDCNEDEVEIGMEVEATFRKLAEDGKSGVIHYGYKFKPVETADSRSQP